MGQKQRGFAISFLPVPEPALGEALLTEPETKLVVYQDLDGMPCPAAKDEHPAGEGVALKPLAA